MMYDVYYPVKPRTRTANLIHEIWSQIFTNQDFISDGAINCHFSGSLLVARYEDLFESLWHLWFDRIQSCPDLDAAELGGNAWNPVIVLVFWCIFVWDLDANSYIWTPKLYRGLRPYCRPTKRPAFLGRLFSFVGFLLRFNPGLIGKDCQIKT